MPITRITWGSMIELDLLLFLNTMILMTSMMIMAMKIIWMMIKQLSGRRKLLKIIKQLKVKIYWLMMTRKIRSL